MLTLQASKAALRLEPWDGGTFSARLAPADRYTAVAANLGPSPMAFARFQIDKDARLSVLRLIFDDGQAYDFTGVGGRAGHLPRAQKQRTRADRAIRSSTLTTKFGHRERVHHGAG